MKIPIPRMILSCLLLSLFAGVHAQDTIVKKIYNTSYTQIAPVIDGQMTDDCWNLVEWGGDFIQAKPDEGKPPSEETRFKILYDDNNLYVLIRADDKEADKISKIMSRRDYFMGDMVEINIDSYFDKQTAFSFSAMASGAKGDEAITLDGNNWDDSWDPIWYLKTSIDDKGWTAEMKIPFSQLRFGKKEEQVWGIQLMRHIWRLEERSTWQFIPKGSPGMVHLFGELHGIQHIKPKRKMELLPYTVAKLERFEKEPGNPFLDGKSTGYSAGLDGKIGITNDLTLDFTINPDFGQVEADPSEVNLTAFETYFSERRPFFIEGKNIYQFSPNRNFAIDDMHTDNLFYSRRIGRYPHYYPSVSEGAYVRVPEATTILGAAKLSGKTKKGLSIGILESVTANEKADIDSAGIRRTESVEPLTNYFVGRIQQDFNKGETVLGGIITSVNRDIANPAMNYLPTSAYAGGIDFKHYWNNREWYVAGNAEVSSIHGDPAAITTLQTSSARYYQRPDADYVSVDSSATSLNGFGAMFKFGRYSQKRFQFETAVTVRSPGLEFNDLGYMRYSDIIHHATWAGYYMRNPFWIFNNFYLNTNYWMYLNFSGELLKFYTNVNFNSQFKNRWYLNGSFTNQYKNISTNLLRGGPAFVLPGKIGDNLQLSTDQSKKFVFFIGTYQQVGFQKSSWTQSYWTSLSIRPMNSLLISLSPDYTRQQDNLQYVTTASLGGNTRYLFSDLDMKTLSFVIRINYTLTPELTVEYYGQPFVSAGKYDEYKLITDPRAKEYTDRFSILSSSEIQFDAQNNSYAIDENGDGTPDFTFGNPDFNFRQFRSNLVARWEYKPGSVLYLVWSQGRTSSDAQGIFSYSRDMEELFTKVPHNIFLVKLSYWFGL